MALNLDSILKLTVKVRNAADIGKIEKAFKGTEKAANQASRSIKKVLSSKLFQAAAVSAASIGTALVGSIKSAISFEAKMAEVTKVLDKIDAKGVEKIKDEIFELSKVLPITVDQVADLFTAAGQAGFAQKDFAKFAEAAGKVGVAFDLTAESAGSFMASMQVVFGSTMDETMLLADHMNTLAESANVSAKDITEFMTRAASSGRAAGLAGKDIAALGTAMIEQGIESRVAATSVRALFGAMTAGASATQGQIDLMRKLGYVTVDAAAEEKRMTTVVEEESRKRIESARNETDQVLKEVRRRYEDLETIAQRALEDESDQVTKNLRRNARARIDAIREQARDQKQGMTEIQKERIRIIEDTLDLELKKHRRSMEDRRTQMSRDLDDQQELEVRANEKKLKALETQELSALDTLKNGIQEKVKQMELEPMIQLASDMFKDGMGTVLNLFTRISELPESEMLSALKEFFGEQGARGIIGLVNNMERLGEVLAVVNDDSKNFGSVLREFAGISETTAAELKLLWNNFIVLANKIGEEFLPHVNKGIQALNGFLEWAIAANEKIPSSVKVILGIGFALASLVIPVGLIISGLAIFAKGLGVTAIGMKGLAMGGVLLIGKLWLLIGAFYLMGKAADAVINFVKHGFEKVGDFIKEHLPSAFSYAWGLIGEGVDYFLKEILFAKFKNFVKSIVKLFKDLFKDIGKSTSGELSAPSTGGSQKVKAYNEGGYVSGSNSGQLAVVGDGGGEYIVPANKVSGFMRNYSQGLRNQAAMPSSRDSGLSVNPSVNVQTGPVMSIQGENYVTVVDLENALNSFAGSLYKNSRSYGGRKYQGVI